jgi:hypothetical protein
LAKPSSREIEAPAMLWMKPCSEDAVPATCPNGVSAPAEACGIRQAKPNA